MYQNINDTRQSFAQTHKCQAHDSVLSDLPFSMTKGNSVVKESIISTLESQTVVNDTLLKSVNKITFMVDHKN